MPTSDAVLVWELKLVWRAFQLRQTRRIPPVWIDAGKISMADSEFGLVHHRVSWSEFEKLIEAAELQPAPARKPVASASGETERIEVTA